MKKKKKIGVVTWYEGPNYGTVLQALAMQLYLKSLGYDPYLVNYKVPYIPNKTNKRNLKDIISKIIIRLYKKLHSNIIQRKQQDLKNIILNNCNMTELVKNDNDYIKICNCFDTLIFGSDQIWNPNWFHPYYYGYYKDIHCNLISYASSFGVNEIPKDKKNKIIDAIRRFNYISVREKKGFSIINKIVKKECSIVGDPTLLIEKEDWNKLCISNKVPNCDYILCYMLNDNFNHWKAIKRFAKKKKLPFYIITYGGYSYLQSKNIITDANIGDFLDLIKNAKYIITDSFHGSIFSLIFEKQFILFERHNPHNSVSQNSRLYNLMDVVGLENRIVKYNKNKIDEINRIDYSKVNARINILKNKSKKYLVNAIEKKK